MIGILSTIGLTTLMFTTTGDYSSLENIPSNKEVVSISTARVVPGNKIYSISRSTTKAELNEIKEAADAVGIKFSYKAKIVSGKIQKLKLKISLSNGGKNSTKLSYNISGPNFNYSFGWKLGGDGKAVKLFRVK